MDGVSTPDVPLQSRVVDDKSPICIPFILSKIEAHKKKYPQEQKPFIIGLNGVQGVGKTTLVRALQETLQHRQGLQTLVVSIDDFYLPHAEQLALAAAHPDNGLVQYRGEPGTHDIPLLTQFFSSLLAGQPTHVPSYNKSAFSGLGDRAPESQWQPINLPGTPKIQVIILEGWCIGFRSLDPAVLETKWKEPDTRTLHNHTLEQLSFVNDSLKKYDVVTNMFDAFIHVDAEDTEYVYEWRLQQEKQLRQQMGSGMTDEQVLKFVDAYYPAYELYCDGVREGIFRGAESKKGCQLRLVVGRDRSVQYKVVI
ncbi:P-loop containing nucleoside triphosphate hydrolase protein [Apodospora peruviana]|uniref:P-loop containing nucleoside triphosphate hydrolase protein n=1 Tax=Apodospora peruviana TaxID=516989 RepID=A0AAE0I675_9PEZI|nr:P-loop containing nucleoside triphosphate hydrolase protein [Apodospora peruviana]